MAIVLKGLEYLGYFPENLQGGEAYIADLPNAEMHRLEVGHFTVEDCLDYISENMHRFYRDSVAPKAKR
jgi:poly-beta-hydroxyalkanoate depolymerase